MPTSPNDPLGNSSSTTITTPTLPHRRRLAALLVVIVLLLVAGMWGYRVTRADYRFARGEQALREGDFDAAEHYAELLESSGASDQANILRGEASLASRNPGRAINYLNRVRPDGPFHLRATAVSGQCLLARGQIREAYQIFQYVVAEQPSHLDAHRGLAIITYDLGQLPESVEHLRQVAALDTTDSRPHRLTGLIYKDLSQLPLAEEAYQEALQRSPPASLERDIRTELAEVLVLQGKYAEGLIALDGGSGVGTLAPEFRAQCLRGLGRQSEASKVLDTAIARQPNLPILHKLRGQIYQDQSLISEALGCYERAIQLDANDHQSHALLGQAYAAVGRNEDSVRMLKRVEELRADLDTITALTREAISKPWDPAVRIRLAEICSRMGRPELATMWQKAAAVCTERPR